MIFQMKYKNDFYISFENIIRIEKYQWCFYSKPINYFRICKNIFEF